eukprot:3932589-Rhodomonas_salina.1
MVACACTSPCEILSTSCRWRVVSNDSPSPLPVGTWPMSPSMACAHASRPMVGSVVTGTAGTLDPEGVTLASGKGGALGPPPAAPVGTEASGGVGFGAVAWLSPPTLLELTASGPAAPSSSGSMPSSQHKA